MFEDCVVIVTGAGQGIGATIAKEFAKDKAIVIVIDFNGENAKQTADEISKIGKVDYFQADVQLYESSI